MATSLWKAARRNWNSWFLQCWRARAASQLCTFFFTQCPSAGGWQCWVMFPLPCSSPMAGFWVSPLCDTVLWPCFTSQVTIAPEKCLVDEMSSWPLGKVLTGSLKDFTTEKHRLTYSKIYPGTCYTLPPGCYRFLRFYAASMVPGCSAVCRPYGLSPSSTCIQFAANHQVRDFVKWVARSGSTCVAAQKWASLGRALGGGGNFGLPACLFRAWLTLLVVFVTFRSLGGNYQYVLSHTALIFTFYCCFF